MRAAASALTCVAFLFVLSGVAWSEPGKKRVYKDVNGRMEITITERKGATWDVAYKLKYLDGSVSSDTGSYASKTGRLRTQLLTGQWNAKTQTLEVTVRLSEGTTVFECYLNGVKPKTGTSAAQDDPRWTGSWVQGAYHYSLTLVGGVLSGPYRAEFNDNDPRHSDFGEIRSTKRDGDAFIGEWKGDYSDGQKQGPRSGTFKLKLEKGATPAEDRITGEMVEVGDAMKKAYADTSMYPGRKYSVSMKRREQ